MRNNRQDDLHAIFILVLLGLILCYLLGCSDGPDDYYVDKNPHAYVVERDGQQCVAMDIMSMAPGTTEYSRGGPVTPRKVGTLIIQCGMSALTAAGFADQINNSLTYTSHK